MHQPLCASSAAVQQHMDSAQLPSQISSSTEHCIGLGGQSMGSPGMNKRARDQNTTQSMDPPAAAEPAGKPQKGSTRGEVHAESCEAFPISTEVQYYPTPATRCHFQGILHFLAKQPMSRKHYICHTHALQADVCDMQLRRTRSSRSKHPRWSLEGLACLQQHVLCSPAIALDAAA